MPFVVVEFRLVFGRREVQNLRPGHRSLIVGIQCDFTLPLDTSHRDVRNLVTLSFDPESDFRHDGSKLQPDRFLAIPDIQNRSRKTNIGVTVGGRRHFVAQNGSSDMRCVADRKSVGCRCIRSIGHEREIEGSVRRPIHDRIVVPDAAPILFDPYVVHEVGLRPFIPLRTRIEGEYPDLRMVGRTGERRSKLYGMSLRFWFRFRRRLRFGVRIGSGIIDGIIVAASLGQSQSDKRCQQEKTFEEELRRHSRNGIIMDNLMLSTQN